MLTADVLLLLLLLLLWLLYLDVGALCWSVRGGGAPLLLLLLAKGPYRRSCFHQSIRQHLGTCWAFAWSGKHCNEPKLL